MALDLTQARNALDHRAVDQRTFDPRGLDSLKRQARDNPQEALKSAAKQFEAVFMQMLLKSMRDAVPESGLLGGGSEEKMFTGMFDQELSQRLAGRGLGIADMIVKQLSRPGASNAAEDQPPGAAPTITGPKSMNESTPRTSIQTPLNTRQALERISAATTEAQTSGAVRAQVFVDRMLPHAAQAERATGVPAHFIVGQAALESGWGGREIRGADGSPSYNLFGIKAGVGWRGATVDTLTTEYVNGQPQKVVEKFRAYGSYAESFQDYAKLLASNPRYAGVLRNGRDAAGFAQSLQAAGYATDPAYADKLTRVINHTISIARQG
jgi:peptidoglycan hydrolase FlgJ